MDVYLVDDILFRLNFQGGGSVGECLCYYMRLSNYMCAKPLIRVWFLTTWVRALRILRWLTFQLLQSFLLERIILFNPCLMYDHLVVIYKYFIYANTLYVSVGSETYHFCLRLFLIYKLVYMLVYSNYMYT